MKRIYLQIYLSFVAILVVFTIVATVLAWSQRPYRDHVPPFIALFSRYIGDKIPSENEDPVKVQRRIQNVARVLELDATLWSPQGHRIANAGEPFRDLIFPENDKAFWVHRGRAGPPGVAVRLHDGRWFAVALKRPGPDRGNLWMLGFAVMALLIAIGAYPISRRIARRIEVLRDGVEELGAGNLDTRVTVEGNDEIATLARSFNSAAERIEHLVSAKRRMLASASHELRSPLARLRVALELMGEDAPEKLRSEAEANIEELDELIEDLLITTRLDSHEAATRNLEQDYKPMDLLEIANAEADRFDVRVEAAEELDTTMRGDARLIRRLLRNLLENAKRYGGSDIRIGLRPKGTKELVIRVEDDGEGVLASERTRIFEPFYRPAGHSEGRDCGVGLGLALVREIAEAHGGDVRCLPRSPKGTIFEVTVRKDRA